MGAPAQTLRHRPSLRDRVAHYGRVLRVIAGIEWKLKYSDSVLGYAWSLIKPLALFSVLYVVFGRFFKLSLGFSEYPLYLLIGIVVWFFFIDAAAAMLPSLVTGGSLLRKLAFPRLILPVSVSLTALLTFSVNLVAIVGLLAWNRVTPRVEWLLIIPLLLELYVFVLGFGIILATLFVRFRDIGQLWELLAQILFYASPIIYPVWFLPPWAQPVAFLSPFVQVIQDVRAIVLGPVERLPIETAPDIYDFALGHVLPVAVALLTFALALLLFKRESPSLAERV